MAMAAFVAAWLEQGPATFRVLKPTGRNGKPSHGGHRKRGPISGREQMAHSKALWIVIPACLLPALSCSSTRIIVRDFQHYRQQLVEEMVPDPSVNLLEAQLRHSQGRWLLQGETTLPAARQRIVSFTDRLLGEGRYRNQMTLLPDRDLMPDQYGLIRVSTAQLRAGPKHSAELVDQAILGQMIRLLKKEGGWFLIQTDYDYIGWMTEESFVRTDLAGVNAWTRTSQIRVRSNYAVVYSEPNARSVPVMDATLNARLKRKKAQDAWILVTAPDGRQGWIRNDDVLPPDTLQHPGLSQRESIVKTAIQMTGVPYLWGGNSSKANDCSGFIQTVFKANGIQLPRDARQQAREGINVDVASEYAELMPGDLLFFGRPGAITHVAISLGGPRFIHQSGDVHVNSLDPTDPDFNASSKETLRFVKRILPGQGGDLLEHASEGTIMKSTQPERHG
jgi:gamma-D-glutamyl-L-lysine dipeptidyl-peptidase